MDDCQELTCLIDITNRTIASIILEDYQERTNQVFCLGSTSWSGRTIPMDNHLENKAFGGKAIKMTTCW
jgi:hypothetical protein